MQFGEFKSTEAFNGTFKRIRELGLEKHIFELDSYGFTVVPPAQVADAAFFERLRETVLRICRERTGVEFQLDRNGEFGHYKAQPQIEGQFLLFYLLMADRIFEEWVLNPTLYTLIDYLMRGQQQLSSLTSFVKWKGERDTLGLHSDCPPDRDGRLPACSDVANAAYCLTDYTLADGAIATWHGAFEKKTDGLRLNVTSYHCHRRLKNQENYQWRVSQEMLDRNPPEFAKLVAADDHMGWDENGPDYSRNMRYASPEVKKPYAAAQREQERSSSRKPPSCRSSPAQVAHRCPSACCR